MTEAKKDRSMNLRRKTVVTVISKIGDRRPHTDAGLVCIHGHALGRMFRLKRGETMIGRSSQATIQIDHESVSRRHAVLHLHESHAVLEDCGSTNGSYVNDEAIETRVLNDGDLIKIGRTILKYLATNHIESAYHEEIYQLSTVDGLTRCYNRRYFRDQLVREVSRAVRYRRPLSLLLCEIDDFQQINDEFGHLAGDAVLTQMGARLARRIRREDTLARWNEGLFAIVAPEVDGLASAMMAERVRGLMSEGSFGFDDVPIPVNFSIAVVGLASIDEQAIAAEEFTSPVTEPDERALFPRSGPYATAPRSEDETGDKFIAMSEALFRTALTRLGEAKLPLHTQVAY